MIKKFRPSEISAISLPVTSLNTRNTAAHPAINIGSCTPFQAFDKVGITNEGTVCIVGNPQRSIGIAKALQRRNRKPLLFIGTSTDINCLSSFLSPEWFIDKAESDLPSGNGAILFSNPHSSYLELCEYIYEWQQEYFVLLHLGKGLKVDIEVINRINPSTQCLILCDSIPQSIRKSESHTLTPLEFMKEMSYLLVSSIGSSSKDLVELLPTYQYEKVTNTLNVNTYSGKSLLNPFHGHRGHGFTFSQARNMEYKKSTFEVDDLKKIFDAGYMLAYNSETDGVYLMEVV